MKARCSVLFHITTGRIDFPSFQPLTRENRLCRDNLHFLQATRCLKTLGVDVYHASGELVRYLMSTWPIADCAPTISDIAIPWTARQGCGQLVNQSNRRRLVNWPLELTDNRMTVYPRLEVYWRYVMISLYAWGQYRYNNRLNMVWS